MPRNETRERWGNFGCDGRYHKSTGQKPAVCVSIAVAQMVSIDRSIRTWLLTSLCLLSAAHAFAGGRAVIADFDGDGRVDRAELDARRPTAVEVHLSRSGTVFVVRSASPILGLVAHNVDGKGGDELITASASLDLTVWRGRHGGLARMAPRTSAPRAVSSPSGQRARQHRPVQNDAVTPSGPPPLALEVGERTTAAAAAAGPLERLDQVRCDSRPDPAPLAPRPPPFAA